MVLQEKPQTAMAVMATIDGEDLAVVTTSTASINSKWDSIRGIQVARSQAIDRLVIAVKKMRAKKDRESDLA